MPGPPVPRRSSGFHFRDIARSLSDRFPLEMTAGKLSTALLLLLLVCFKYGHCGVKKIKIHVPYYVKHVHHYKKVYVPKIHVIKHEHHHKKEYDHHHHHHEVLKHGPYRSYDKSSHEYPDELNQHEVYYDDVESKSYRAPGRKRVKPWGYRAQQQYRGWKDVDGSDYRGDSGEEDDYPAYRKNVYFKRRSGSGEEGDEEEEDPEQREEGLEEEEEEEQQTSQEEEEEEEESTTSPGRADAISITTTGRPLL